MNYLKEQQEEALQALTEYLGKLIPGVNNVIAELQGNRKEDTGEYFDMIIKGINWSIEVLNATRDLLNQNEMIIDKVDINSNIAKFQNSLKSKNDTEIANGLSEYILPFLNKLLDATNAYTSKM